MDASRALPWYISSEDEPLTSVLLPESYAHDTKRLRKHLRKLKPKVPKMRAAALRHATRLQYSYSELGPADHAEVGPDALDVALWALTADKPLRAHQPQKQSQHASRLHWG